MATPRRYTKRQRARSEAETRARIVEAAMHLHEEMGPRATTISAIAERAGVQRVTVYRHFPDETAVFQACTTHWLTLNPLPDPARWNDIADPIARARTAVERFYDYYLGTERMWSAAYRDAPEVPALQGPMADVAAFLGTVSDGLAAPFGRTGRAGGDLRATIRHVLDFSAWLALHDAGLGNADKLRLAMTWIGATAAGGGSKDPG